MGAVTLLQDRQTVGKFALAAEGGGVDLVCHIGLVAELLDRIGDRVRGNPVLPRELDAG